jgi:hypothetical protein
VSDTRHLSDQELMDALEGDAQGASHLDACGECRAQLEAAREGLRLAVTAEVPEPSPLYWEAFRRQLDRRLDERRPARGWWRLTPMLAAAAVLVAIVGVLPLQMGAPPSPSPASAPTWSALPPAEEDGALSLLEASISSSDDLREAGVATGTEELAGLTDDESRALTEVLRREMVGTGRRDS